MLVNVGDKLVVTKRIAGFLKEGDIVEIIDANENGLISFVFGDNFMHKGLMSVSECEQHFEKYEEPKTVAAPTVTPDIIDEIIVNSNIEVMTIFDKCTIVACQLPNGFVIVESSACVSPENYDEETGVNICLDKIADKIWELEGYKLQEELVREEFGLDECPCDDCDEYPYCEECCVEVEEDEELDCGNCDEYTCPVNPNYHVH